MNLTLPANKNKWIENFARFGYGAKGIVYCLVGILALMAALGSGSSSRTSKKDVFGLVLEQPFGKVLLALIALGLVGYVIWRAIEAIKDPHNHGNRAKGIFKRIGYAISAAVYLALSFYAFKLVLSPDSSDGGNGTKEMVLTKLLDHTAGQWLVGIAALIIIGQGIKQIFKSISGKYKKDLESGKIDHKYREILVKAGGVGYIARGIVWGIIGYLLLRAAFNANPSQTNGTEDALDFIYGFGEWVLGAVAIGLFCYGIFKILEGLYRRLSTSNI